MAVQVKNISVSFPGVKALQDVSLAFAPGRVHAVLGANGSGKSTMVKVLTGIYQPDKDSGGQIIIGDKKAASLESPTASAALGIRVVHQESPLVHSFTVAECIALFKGYPKKAGRIDWKAVNAYTKALLEKYSIHVDPSQLTESLTASERNMIAMAIAMGTGEELKQTRMLILDEADASIPEAEAESFLQHVRSIADMGIPVMMVSHRLKSVMQFCDDVSILNDGCLVYSGQMDATDEETIIANMMKRDTVSADGPVAEETHTLTHLWEMLKHEPPAAGTEPVLEMQDVHSDTLHGFSLRVLPGEIVGVVGVSDSGVGELPRILGGESAIGSGVFSVGGQSVPARPSPRRMIGMGVGLLPCDRPVNSSIQSLSLRENMLLPSEQDYFLKGGLDKKVTNECLQLFDINPRNDITMPFGKFSGGNQQKAIMAKWLSMCPRLFVLDDPTYGVDPASRLRIFETMRAAAENNVGLVVFSTEPEQLVNVCTRIVAVQAGRVAAELAGEELTRESIARWSYI